MKPKDTAIRTAALTALFAAVHSLVASLPVKRAARERVGERRADGLYRFGYCGFAVITFGAILRYLWTLPDERLYRVRGIPAALLVGGQALCVAGLLQANWRNGLGRVTGIRHLYEYLTGRTISRPPVAQHPLPDGDCMEGWNGMFRLSSHPNNYLVMGLWWLSPVMTVKWASLGAVMAAYMVLGSMHEDHRLSSAYGEAYQCYRSRVPHLFLLPVDHFEISGGRIRRKPAYVAGERAAVQA